MCSAFLSLKLCFKQHGNSSHVAGTVARPDEMGLVWREEFIIFLYVLNIRLNKIYY